MGYGYKARGWTRDEWGTGKGWYRLPLDMSEEVIFFEDDRCPR